MESQKDMFDLLDMMTQPVFCVKDAVIVRSNAVAQQLFPEIGESILPLLGSSAEAYKEFTDGCLYLSLSIAGLSVGACVRRMEDMDIFELDSSENDSFRAMALAACAMRKPLNSALSEAASLLDSQDDPQVLQQLSQLNRSLYQLLRMLGNMSDAEYISTHYSGRITDIPALFREIFEKAQTLLERSHVTLTYEGMAEPVYALADSEQLERAVLNILSNAAKFTPKGGHIQASLVRRGNCLRLSVQDSGSGIAQDIMGSLFRRHLRQPGIEDSRYGLGLGMHLIHAAAIHHGGTLLVTQGENGGTRIVFTIAMRQKESGSLASPISALDCSGGFDRTLVELSECLSPELFDGSY